MRGALEAPTILGTWELKKASRFHPIFDPLLYRFFTPRFHLLLTHPLQGLAYVCVGGEGVRYPGGGREPGTLALLGGQ